MSKEKLIPYSHYFDEYPTDSWSYSSFIRYTFNKRLLPPNPVKVYNYKYKKCLDFIEQKYDSLKCSKAISLKKSFKIDKKMEGEWLASLNKLAKNEEIEEHEYHASLNKDVREEKIIYSSHLLESRKSKHKINIEVETRTTSTDPIIDTKDKDVFNQPPSKRVKNDEPEQQRNPETNGEIPAHDDKSNNESIMSDSPIYDEFAREMKVADETNEYYSDPESTESVNNDDVDYVYSSESSSCDVVEKTKIEFTEFEKTYLKMNDSDKWKLSTGKIVEDALYNFGIKCRHEHLYLLTYLNSFRVSDISSLRDAIFKSQQWDSPYNRQTHFDYDWIRNTAYNLLHEYEAGSLEKDHLELWLLVHVWNFVDRGFGNIDGLETARSESSSRASSNRKNRNRTGSAIVKMKRKIMGRRGDLIIRKVSTEYGCSEAGKSFEAVGNEEEKIRKLQSIGFIHSSLMILLLRLDSPAGYTCRITRTKMLEVPSQIAQFGAKVLPVIMLAWKAKMIVKETIEFVEQKQYSENEEDTDDQLQNL
ncbi:hypothetical protein GLOIN_2v1741550 [Rhizophagus irregularis DAOM 181602=DAOM 197198]|nr:hypothetical protein GLOIN_2v1741550 [Rhizophagus irregularis DAOM 181602=DAOM 197198]